MHEEELDNRFSDLFTEAEPMLYRFAFSLCANRSDADDVLQDAMASLWRRFDENDPKRPFAAVYRGETPLLLSSPLHLVIPFTSPIPLNFSKHW
jgi:hypothetical protein